MIFKKKAYYWVLKYRNHLVEHSTMRKILLLVLFIPVVCRSDWPHEHVPQIRCIPQMGYFEISKLNIYNASLDYSKLGFSENIYPPTESCQLSASTKIDVSHKKLIIFKDGKEILQNNNNFDRFRVFIEQASNEEYISLEACIISTDINYDFNIGYEPSGCVYEGAVTRNGFSLSYKEVRDELAQREFRK